MADESWYSKAIWIIAGPILAGVGALLWVPVTRYLTPKPDLIAAIGSPDIYATVAISISNNSSYATAKDVSVIIDARSPRPSALPAKPLGRTARLGDRDIEIGLPFDPHPELAMRVPELAAGAALPEMILEVDPLCKLVSVDNKVSGDQPPTLRYTKGHVTCGLVNPHDSRMFKLRPTPSAQISPLFIDVTMVTEGESRLAKFGRDYQCATRITLCSYNILSDKLGLVPQKQIQ